MEPSRIQDSLAFESQDELAREARNGNIKALARLFEHYRPRLLRIVDARMDRRMQGRLDPTDLLQETFLELSSKLPAFIQSDSSMSFFVWMRLTAVQRVIMAYRQHLQSAGRDVRKEGLPVGLQQDSTVMLADHLFCRFTSVGRKAIRREIGETIQQTLESMQEVDREIITMRCFEDLSNAEAAQSLGISQNGASSRFVRAMARLKAELSKIPGFDG